MGRVCPHSFYCFTFRPIGFRIVADAHRPLRRGIKTLHCPPEQCWIGFDHLLLA